VHDYQLEELGPRAFEQLAVALARTVTGPGLKVYGSGPDGGREATYDGPIDWSAAGGGPTWTGYTVVQAKHCEHPSDTDPQRNLAWLKPHLRNEIGRWMDPDSPRGRFPNNLLIVTNVRLSSGDPHGGIDQVDQFTTQCLDRNYGPRDNPRTPRSRGLGHVKVWHRDDLNAALTEHDGIRHAFPALLTAGDILARIDQLTAQHRLPDVIDPERFAKVLVDHAHTTLGTQRWVRFDEAGDDTEKQSVERVIVNVPARDQDNEPTHILRPCLARGDEVLRQSMWLSDTPGQSPPPRHLVITGAPGNGKTTLARYLTQVYRAKFAQHEVTEPTIATVIDATMASMRRLHLPQPTSARWPLRVDLAPMAEAMGPGDGGPTLRRWLCRLINHAANVDVNPATLDNWLKAWPCVLIFDGLDEVTHIALRQRVINEITALVEKADANDADLFVIVTTRPTGYTERLLPDHFAQIDLDYLSPKEAEAYGHHVTQQRYHNDPERGDVVLAAFKAALANPGTERLLKTPLQVLILTVIASSGPLPANRYLLFWTYYETVFRREAAKPTTFRDFFTNHRADITELHQKVGLLLQIQCEATSEIRGRMPRTELRELAKERMLAVGHRIETANELADRMIEVATKRLVLLAPDEDDTVSFDVRSLQELMAGCALVDGDEGLIRQNLTTTAVSPHWRNTWLFAAGRLYTGGEHHRGLVLDIIDQCDQRGHWPGWLYQAAPELAADMLDDGLAATRPNDQRRLLDMTLRCLDGPVPEDPKAIARGLWAAAKNSTEHQLTIRGVLRDAVNSNGVRQSVAANLLHYGNSFGSTIPGLPEEMSRYVDMWRYKHPTGAKHSVGALLRDALDRYTGGLDYPGRELVNAALDECEQLVLRRTASGDLWSVSSGKVFNCAHLHAALADSDASAAVQIALDALEPNDWAARSMLARSYWPAVARWPIGSQFRSPVAG
jgi:energy-coupling factor transporter ATP-binding protein EcfA2